ncbi:MAG TPA: hypothetical protein EYQ60_14860 [Myxococcales bacterium]|nr:hypothetical protein [Myxococcales bacterium]
MRLPYRSLLALCSLVCAIQAHAFDAATFASTVTDPVRARNILYMVYYPENFSGVSPLILVSHGGIGSAIGFLEAPHLGTEYAEMGYIAIHVNHAASANILIHRTDRPADVSFIIDQLEAATLPLPFAFLGSIDLTRIGHIGHSFGGHTAYLLRAETSPMATWVTPGWMPWWHYHRWAPVNSEHLTTAQATILGSILRSPSTTLLANSKQQLHRQHPGPRLAAHAISSL